MHTFFVFLLLSWMELCTCSLPEGLMEPTASPMIGDVPSPPTNVQVHCQQRTANVSWENQGGDRIPPLEYIIQYSTSFEPGVWVDHKPENLSGDFSRSMELSPWATYTFRVTARNTVGLSNASAPSQEVCTTPPDIPYKNPENVQVIGTEPNNLVISWTPMPQIDHNGPGFYYEVQYIRADLLPSASQINDSIHIKDWRQSSVSITHQPTYAPYNVRVLANNDLGRSRAADEPPVRLYSGEGRPTTAPGNPHVTRLLDSRTAEISWTPVPADSIRGVLKGYRIQVTPAGATTPKEIRVGPNTSSAVVDILKPASRNVIRILPYNGKYDGPASDELVIETQPIFPGRPVDIRASTMGHNMIFLEWKEPTEPSGGLRHYEINVFILEGLSTIGPVKNLRVPRRLNSMKLMKLTPDTKYRIFLYAANENGRGEPGIVEAATGSDPSETGEAIAK
ncbi:neuroglian-like [Paramacrobiotus metropolitanus]|uniref:neuroglian-like n=1 Tax=Paramacrobiotus metropolitanus TaxID=2943436 RepID=UPI0024464326|nr:neuroglian-like [Paramacrobiotus metropolitanus]